MEIATPQAHKILAYLSGVARQGYYPTVDELTEYASAPDQKVADAPFGAATASIFSVLARLGGEKESKLDWLTRLGWIYIRPDRRVGLTDLGGALVRALDEQEQGQEQEAGLAVALNKDDPFAYAQVIARLAQHEGALLVDPYLRVQELRDVVAHTSINRVLTGDARDGDKRRVADLAGLAVAVAQLQPGRIEIRVSDDLHDRFVIPPTGAVDALGTSLGGIGKSPTFVTAIQPPVADTIRAEVFQAWSAATPLPVDVLGEQEALDREGSGQADGAAEKPHPTSDA